MKYSVTCLAFAGLWLTKAMGDTVTVTPIADCEIREDAPDLNVGRDTSVVAGELGSSAGFPVRRALFQFELAGQIPPGSLINSVTVRVVAVKKVPLNPANSTFDLRRLLSSWAETQTTWNSRLSSVPWQGPGASGPQDAAAAASSSVFVTGLGSYTFPSTASLVADVQSWVDNPGSNFGWLLMSEAETTPRTARHFATRESGVNAPRLVIVFTPPSLGIVTQPQSQTNFVGDTVGFSVRPSGTPPFSYQWTFNNVAIPGATADTLVLTNVQFTASGQYQVFVTNAIGSTNSLPASLTVLPAAFVQITSPTNGTRLPLGSAVPVLASASRPVGELGILLNQSLVGTSTSNSLSLLLTNLPAGTNLISAFATDLQQNSATSAVVRVSIVPPPQITLAVASTNVAIGTAVTNVATVTREGLELTNATVLFFGGSTLLEQRVASPYQFVVASDAGGLLTFSAVAVDEFGLSSTSAPVTIRFHTNEAVLPRLAITREQVMFPQVRLSGTATDEQGIDRIECRLLNGPFLTSTGAVLQTGLEAPGSSWSLLLDLAPGRNAVHVRSVDFAGNFSAEQVRFYNYVQFAELQVETEGDGTVLPNLSGQRLLVGKPYRVTAKPGRGQIFAGWDGISNASSPNLTFIMSSTPAVLRARFETNRFLCVRGSYMGVFFPAADVQPENAGILKLQLSSSGAFSGRLVMMGKSHAFQGRFDLSGAAVLPVFRNGVAATILNLHLDLTNCRPQLTGFVTNLVQTNLFSSPLFVERNTFQARTNPAPQIGIRQFVLKERASQHAVTRYAAANFTSSGTVQFFGQLEDGRSLALTTILFEKPAGEGNVPVYFVLSGGREILIGVPHFGVDPSDVHGQLFWIGPGASSPILDLEPR